MAIEYVIAGIIGLGVIYIISMQRPAVATTARAARTMPTAVPPGVVPPVIPTPTPPVTPEPTPTTGPAPSTLGPPEHPEEFYESVFEKILNTNIALDCLKLHYLNQMQRNDPTCHATILSSQKTGQYTWEVYFRIDCEEFNPGRLGNGVIIVENGVCKNISFL